MAIEKIGLNSDFSTRLSFRSDITEVLSLLRNSWPEVHVEYEGTKMNHSIIFLISLLLLIYSFFSFNSSEESNLSHIFTTSTISRNEMVRSRLS